MKLKTAIALTLIGTLISACTQTGLPIINRNETTLNDAVLAIRLSPQLRHISHGARKGYLILATANGTAKAVEIGAMDTGQLAWTKKGLYISSRTEELLLTTEGLKSFPRSTEEESETTRFITKDGQGFIAVYNTGRGEKGYEFRVVSGNGQQITEWDSKGLFTSIGQCGNKLVGISDVKDTAAPNAAQSPQAEPDNDNPTDVLIQISPQPSDPKNSILSTLKVDGYFAQHEAKAPCVNGSLYTIGFYLKQKGAGLDSGIPVIRRWNIQTGKHDVHPLLDKAGKPSALTPDDITIDEGHTSNMQYRWISKSGKVFVTNLNNGQTTEEYDLQLSSPDRGESQFFLTEKSIYVLDISQDDNAPIDFSVYQVATGKRESLFTLEGLNRIHHGNEMVIRDIALNPDWVQKTGR